MNLINSSLLSAQISSLIFVLADNEEADNNSEDD
jgi:hypothetical protein